MGVRAGGMRGGALGVMRGGGGRKSGLGGAGWTAMADALEAVTTLTRLNGCDGYAAIRAGAQSELALGGTELAVAVARYLPRSGATLGRLDLRCCPTAHSATGG